MSARTPLTVLVVSSDPAVSAALDPALLSFPATVRSCPDADAADRALAHAPADLLVIDDALPGETGLMFLARRIKHEPGLRGVLICSPLDPELFLRLLNDVRNVFCLLVPWRAGELRTLVARAAEETAAARAAAHALDQTTRPTRMLAAWSHVLPRLGLITLIAFLATFAAGGFAIASLYVLKTVLGIDLVNDAHLSDLWR